MRFVLYDLIHISQRCHHALLKFTRHNFTAYSGRGLTIKKLKPCECFSQDVSVKLLHLDWNTELTVRCFHCKAVEYWYLWDSFELFKTAPSKPHISHTYYAYVCASVKSFSNSNFFLLSHLKSGHVHWTVGNYISFFFGFFCFTSICKSINTHNCLF